MSQSNKPKKITLKCCKHLLDEGNQPENLDEDNQTLDVEEVVAMEMGILQPILNKNTDNPLATIAEAITIPICKVKSAQLRSIISYLQKYLEIKGKAERDTKDIEALNAEFVKDMSGDELKQMALAANYLDIKYLLDLFNRAIADHIKNKSVEYVRNLFGIDDPEFEEGEEEKLRKMYARTFEDVDQD